MKNLMKYLKTFFGNSLRLLITWGIQIAEHAWTAWYHEGNQDKAHQWLVEHLQSLHAVKTNLRNFKMLFNCLLSLHLGAQRRIWHTDMSAPFAIGGNWWTQTVFWQQQVFQESRQNSDKKNVCKTFQYDEFGQCIVFWSAWISKTWQPQLQSGTWKKHDLGNIKFC